MDSFWSNKQMYWMNVTFQREKKINGIPPTRCTISAQTHTVLDWCGVDKNYYLMRNYKRILWTSSLHCVDVIRHSRVSISYKQWCIGCREHPCTMCLILWMKSWAWVALIKWRTRTMQSAICRLESWSIEITTDIRIELMTFFTL